MRRYRQRCRHTRFSPEPRLFVAPSAGSATGRELRDRGVSAAGRTGSQHFLERDARPRPSSPPRDKLGAEAGRQETPSTACQTTHTVSISKASLLLKAPRERLWP